MGIVDKVLRVREDRRRYVARAFKVWTLARFALSFGAAAALLAGCGGSHPPIGVPGAMSQGRVVASHADRSGSWILTEAKREDLLYISDWRAGNVYIYSYPAGKMVGTLTGFALPSGLCVDKAGDVWVTSQENGDIIEFPHGGTVSIGMLRDSGLGMDCAIDPVTGNLAATSLEGGVWIWQGARGSPVLYQPPHLVQPYYCSYDDVGNLYVDGFPGLRGYRVGLDELAKGSSSFFTITLPFKIDGPGGVQWDGQYLAVSNSGHHVYRYTIAGSVAELSGVVHLKNAGFLQQFWIERSTIIGPSRDDGEFLFWKYPVGGEPIKTFSGLAQPDGAAVSLAQEE